MAVHYLDTVSQNFSADPAVDANGLPTAAQWTTNPPAVVRSTWGRVAIIINGTDYTYFRGKASTVESFQSLDPFGDGPAVFKLPQITPFDDVRTLIPPGSLADLYHVTPSETLGNRLWSGTVIGYEDSDPGISVECTGAFFDLDRFIAKPDFYDDAGLSTRDTTAHIKDRINNDILANYNVGLSNITGPFTGINQRNPGAFEPLVTGWIKELLGKAEVAQTPTDDVGGYDPSIQWTIYCRERAPYIFKRVWENGVYTLQAGAPGVDVTLSEDYVGIPSAIYGHGVSEDNCSWYNTKYPGLREWEEPLGAPPTWVPGPSSGGYSVGDGGALVATIKEELINQGFGSGLSPVGSAFAATDFIDGPIGWFKVATGHVFVGDGSWSTLAGWITFDQIDFNNLFQIGTLTPLGPPFYLPIWEDTRTKPFNYDSHGNVTGPNTTDFDPDLPRIEEFVDYGKSNKFAAAIEARRRIENYNESSKLGTITLNTDPPSVANWSNPYTWSGSRFEMRAGENIDLYHYRGSPTPIRLHIVQAEHNLEQGTTTLTVDERNRDYMTIQAIHERNLAAKSDPASRIRKEVATSKIRDDKSPPWDCEAGSGIIPRTAVQYGFGGWTIIKFPAARFGKIASLRLELVTVSGDPLPGVFLAGIWGREVTSDQVLIATGGSVNEVDWNGVNPTWPNGTDTALVYAAGRPTSALGWWPNEQGDHNDPAQASGTDPSNPYVGPVTGVYEDNGSWEFYSQEPPWLWLSVLSSTQGYIQGRLRFADTQPEE